MAILDTTMRPLRPKAERTPAQNNLRCAACQQERARSEYGVGTRGGLRRVCRHCTDAVDTAIGAGASSSAISANLHVSAAVIADRRLALNAATARASTGKAPAPRSCTACRQLRRVHNFALRTNARGQQIRHRICERCLAEVDRQLLAGTATSAVADRTRVSLATVRAQRRALGLPDELPRTPATTLAQIDELARQGVGARSIAERIGVDHAHVRRRLAARPGEPRAPRTSTGDLLRQARALLEDGASYAEVGRTVGLSAQTISDHLPGFGSTREHRALVAWIHQDRDRSELQRQIDAIAG